MYESEGKMAAVAYPYCSPGLRPRHRTEERDRTGTRLALVPSDDACSIETRSRTELRRALCHKRRAGRSLIGLLSLTALVGTYFGAGLLASAHSLPEGRLPGAHAVGGGYAYVVRAGDTLWSIASQLDPSGDPRALVGELTTSLHGSAIRPGEHIVVPLH